jgi:hypothetical protein
VFVSPGYDLVVDDSAGCDNDFLHDLEMSAVVQMITDWGPWPGALSGRQLPIGCGCTLSFTECNDVADCPLCSSDRDRSMFYFPI